MENPNPNLKRERSIRYLLSPHLIKMDSADGASYLLHRWTGRAIKTSHELFEFLEMFKSPLTTEDIRLCVSVEDLGKKLDKLFEMAFLISPDIDEEMQFLKDTIGIKEKCTYCTNNFIFLYQSGFLRRVQFFSRLAEKAYSFLIQKGFKELSQKPIVFFCSSNQEYRKLWESNITDHRPLFFVTKSRILVVNYDGIDDIEFNSELIYKTVVHEMVHIFLCRQYVNLPIWAVEGICEYFSRENETIPYEKLKPSGDLLCFEEIEKMTMYSLIDISNNPEVIEKVYLQVFAFIVFCIDRFGANEFMDCVSSTGFSINFRDAFLIKFSSTVEGVEIEWHRHIDSII